MKFETPKPNKLIAAMQQLVNKKPTGLNTLFPGQPQHYLGTWLSAEPLDANLSVVRLQGGTIVRFVPKSTTATFVANDVIKLEKSSILMLHITGKLVGNINLAAQNVSNVSPPGAPSGYNDGTKTSTTCHVVWTPGVDHFGSGLTFQVFLNGAYRQSTAVGATSADITGLTAGHTYSSYVTATDGAGNTSAKSNSISFTTTGTPPPAGGSTVTKTYKATNLRSYNYNGGNERNSWHDGNAYQGADQNGGHNTFGLIAFPWSQIDDDLDGYTPIQAVVGITYAHWWKGAGGTAVIGTHDYSSLPSSSASFSHIDPARWTAHSNAGSRLSITMGAGVCGQFQSGSAKGISIGEGLTTSTQYYGYTYGTGTHCPTLTLTWQT